MSKADWPFKEHTHNVCAQAKSNVGKGSYSAHEWPLEAYLSLIKPWKTILCLGFQLPKCPPLPPPRFSESHLLCACCTCVSSSRLKTKFSPHRNLVIHNLAFWSLTSTIKWAGLTITFLCSHRHDWHLHAKLGQDLQRNKCSMTSEADTLKTTSYTHLCSQQSLHPKSVNTAIHSTVTCQIQASMNGFWPLVATESEALPAVKELKHTLGSFSNLIHHFTDVENT